MTTTDKLVDEIFSMHGWGLFEGEKKFSRTSSGYQVVGQINKSKYGIELTEQAMTKLLEINPKLKELYVAYCLEYQNEIR